MPVFELIFRLLLQKKEKLPPWILRSTTMEASAWTCRNRFVFCVSWVKPKNSCFFHLYIRSWSAPCSRVSTRTTFPLRESVVEFAKPTCLRTRLSAASVDRREWWWGKRLSRRWRSCSTSAPRRCVYMYSRSTGFSIRIASYNQVYLCRFVHWTWFKRVTSRPTVCRSRTALWTSVGSKCWSRLNLRIVLTKSKASIGNVAAWA